MRAQVAAGRTAAALSTYDRLARRLRDELGTDPDQATTDLHVAVLRATTTVPEQRPQARPVPALIGREAEVGVLDRAWTDAGARTGRLLLVEGEAGIGKTRLLEALVELADRSGGRVLRSRCHPTERSLFLQPYVDALRPVLLDATAGRRRPPAPRAHRRLGRAAARARPAGRRRRAGRRARPSSSAAGRTTRWRPSCAAWRSADPCCSPSTTCRTAAPPPWTCWATSPNGSGTPRAARRGGPLRGRRSGRPGLADRATVVPLGALPRSAVDALAAAAGLGAHGATVMERTAGPPAERRGVACGRWRPGTPGCRRRWPRPSSPGWTGSTPRCADVVGAGSVLGRRLDPLRLAALTGSDELSVVRHCEELARVRLLVRSELGYEFVNDLVQECVHAHLPPALAAAYHRRAADLTSDRPETMAAHAFAAGDLERAAKRLAAGRRRGDAAGGPRRRGRAVRPGAGRGDHARAAGAAAAGAGARPRGADLVRPRAAGHRRGAAARPGGAGPAARDDGAAGPRGRRARGAAASVRRDRRPPGGRPRAGLRAGRPSVRGELHHPAHRPGVQPAAAGRRADPVGGGPRPRPRRRPRRRPG